MTEFPMCRGRGGRRQARLFPVVLRLVMLVACAFGMATPSFATDRNADESWRHGIDPLWDNMLRKRFEAAR